jgi:hypothetical protein
MSCARITPTVENPLRHKEHAAPTPAPAKLSSVASKRAEALQAYLYSTAFYLQNAVFFKWAMLDLNQRPPPCKLGRAFPVGLCSI